MNAGQKRLYIHIGRHKTGSTSVQAMLHKQSDRLASQGVRVIKRSDYAHLNLSRLSNRRRPANLFDIGNSLVRSKLMTGPKMRGNVFPPTDAQKPEVARALNVCFKALPAQTLLMSAESFSFFRTPEEKALVDILTEGFEVKTLLILREMSDWLRSYRKQTSRLREQFESIVGLDNTNFDLRPGSFHFKIETVKSIFPNVETLNYGELLEKDGSVIPEVLRWLDLNPADYVSELTIWENKTV